MRTSVDSDEIDLQPSDLDPMAIRGSGDPDGDRTPAHGSAAIGAAGARRCKP